MKSLFLTAALFSGAVSAQCFGPVCPDSQPVIDPIGPTVVCVETCTPVTYAWFGQFIIAETVLPNGYPIIGWSGPCFDGICPDAPNQAAADLRMNALRVNRAQRFLE